MQVAGSMWHSPPGSPAQPHDDHFIGNIHEYRVHIKVTHKINWLNITHYMRYGTQALTEPSLCDPNLLVRSCPAKCILSYKMSSPGGTAKGYWVIQMSPRNGDIYNCPQQLIFIDIWIPQGILIITVVDMFWPSGWSSPCLQTLDHRGYPGRCGSSRTRGHTSFHVASSIWLIFYHNIRVPVGRGCHLLSIEASLVVSPLRYHSRCIEGQTQASLIPPWPPGHTRTLKNGCPPLHLWRQSVGTQTHQVWCPLVCHPRWHGVVLATCNPLSETSHWESPLHSIKNLPSSYFYSVFPSSLAE